jgi:RHS repeat-associated protein
MLYDGNDIVAEIGGGAVSAFYLRSLNIDEPFVRQTMAGNEFYHADALGSSVALTNQAGAVPVSYSYEAFGKTTVTGPSSNPFQYTGRENDGTGLYNYRARSYSSTVHRFISEEVHTITFPRSCVLQGPLQVPNAVRKLVSRHPIDLNLYQYARLNPLTFVDPTGLRATKYPDCPDCDLFTPKGCEFYDEDLLDISLEGTQTGRFIVCIYQCTDKKTGETTLQKIVQRCTLRRT